MYENKAPKVYRKTSMFLLVNVGRGKPALRLVKKGKEERRQNARCVATPPLKRQAGQQPRAWRDGNRQAETENGTTRQRLA